MPNDECGIAYINLLGKDDNCSRTAEGLFGDGNDTSLINLYLGDCPTRFHNYATACSESFGNSSDDVSSNGPTNGICKARGIAGSRKEPWLDLYLDLMYMPYS